MLKPAFHLSLGHHTNLIQATDYKLFFYSLFICFTSFFLPLHHVSSAAFDYSLLTEMEHFFCHTSKHTFID